MTANATAQSTLLAAATAGVPLPRSGERRHIAVIDNDHCIGCTKCIRACPFEAIVGAPKHQHHVLADRCTGCDLCALPCPTDCIGTSVIEPTWNDATVARAIRQFDAQVARRSRLASAQTSSRRDGPDDTLRRGAHEARSADSSVQSMVAADGNAAIGTGLVGARMVGERGGGERGVNDPPAGELKVSDRTYGDPAGGDPAGRDPAGGDPADDKRDAWEPVKGPGLSVLEQLAAPQERSRRLAKILQRAALRGGSVHQGITRPASTPPTP